MSCYSTMELQVQTPYTLFLSMLIIWTWYPASLNNLSSDIRWSLDLRWQRPDKPVGFYGVKDGVLLRSKSLTKEHIDWDSFDNNNLFKKCDKNLKVRS